MKYNDIEFDICEVIEYFQAFKCDPKWIYEYPGGIETNNFYFEHSVLFNKLPLLLTVKIILLL